MVVQHSDVMVRMSESQLRGDQFNSSISLNVTTPGSWSHTHAFVNMQYNLVLVKGSRYSVAGKVTASLAESNGSIPLCFITSHLCALLTVSVNWDQLQSQCA